ncbi:MAG: hypothetical protein FJZ80_02330 [Bacteroidetes bacterium]|nr:hypothetical protein [Bacteroidota bacterium]
MRRIIVAFLLFSSTLFSQSYRISSTAKNVISAHAGHSFNRFLPSRFTLQGNEFDLTLNHAQFDPIKEKWTFSRYLTSPFKLGLGWNIRKNFQIMLEVDNFKYLLAKQVLQVSGTVAPFYDQLGGLSGNYLNTPVDMDTVGFGINMQNIRLISLNFQRLRPLVHYKNHSFAAVASYGIGLGFLQSSYSVNFGSAIQEDIASLSGMAGGLNLGMRLEFFGVFYLMSSLTGGLMVHKNLRLSLTESNQKAQQNLWFGQASISVGTIFFPGKKKNCDCPHF